MSTNAQPERTVETASLSLNVTIEVAPADAGADLVAAAAEFESLVREYLTSPENPFLGDYGTTVEKLAHARRTGEQDQLSWGGYGGPFAVAVKVERAPIGISTS